MLVINFLISELKKVKFLYFCFFIVVCCIPITFVFGTKAAKNLVDVVQSGDVSAIRNAIFFLFISQLLVELFWRIRDFIKIEFSIVTKMNTFNSIIEILLAKNPTFFKNNSVSSIVAISRYISESVESIFMVHFKSIRYIVYSISASYTIFCQNTYAGLIIILWILSWGLANFIAFGYLSKYVVNLSDLKSQFLAQLSDSFFNTESIFLYNTQDHEKEKLYSKTEEIMKYERSTERILWVLWIFQGTIFSLVMLFLLLVTMNTSKNIVVESGKFVMIIRLLIEFASQMWSFSDDMTELIDSYAKIKSGLAQIQHGEGQIELASQPTIEGNCISFDKVCFSQENKQFFFDCSLPNGKNIALIGPSGSGKTTFINLLLGILKPDSGKISIYSKNFSYVPQDIRLFNASAKYNLNYGLNKESDEDEIKKVMDKCKLDFIYQLKDGCHTIINNEVVSGGQAQRIAIGRCLLHKSEILIFDEPTSALDAENEREIVDIILSSPGTKIIISHKASTIKKSDIVLLFKDGRILDKGKYEELYLNSEYTNFFDC